MKFIYYLYNHLEYPDNLSLCLRCSDFYTMGNINTAAWYRKQMCNSLIKVILDLDLQV